MRLLRAGVIGAFFTTAAALAACGGTNSSLTAPPATAAPNATATPVPAASPSPASAATPAPATGTTAVAVGNVPLPAPSGYAASFTLPGTTVVPAGTKVTSTVAVGAPTGLNATFSTDRAKASLRTAQLAGATILGSASGSVSNSFTLGAGSSFTFTGTSVAAGATVFAALDDNSSSAGYVYNPPQFPCVATAGSVTCTSNASFPLVAGVLYSIVVYTQANATPNPVPTTVATTVPTTAPTTVPTTVPTTGPSGNPTTAPTTAPTTKPTTAPTTTPTTAPSATPSAVPTATPIPAPVTAVQAIPTAPAGATYATANVPGPAGDYASVQINASSYVPAGTTLTSTFSLTQPTSIPTFNVAGATVYSYVTLTTNNNLVMSSSARLMENITSALNLNANRSIYVAGYDGATSNSQTGGQFVNQIPGVTCATTGSTGITCNSTNSFQILANHPYTLVMYSAPTNTAATPAPQSVAFSYVAGGSFQTLTIPGIGSSQLNINAPSIPSGAVLTGILSSNAASAGLPTFTQGVPIVYGSFTSDRTATFNFASGGVTVALPQAAFPAGTTTNGLNVFLYVGGSYYPAVANAGNYAIQTFSAGTYYSAAVNYNANDTAAASFQVQANTTYGFVYLVDDGDTPMSARRQP